MLFPFFSYSGYFYTELSSNTSLYTLMCPHGADRRISRAVSESYKSLIRLTALEAPLSSAPSLHDGRLPFLGLLRKDKPSGQEEQKKSQRICSCHQGPFRRSGAIAAHHV